MFSILLQGGAPGGAGPQAGPWSGYGTILMFVVIFVLMYMFMIRPQQKKEKTRQKMISELKKGDKVLTNSGIIGSIWGIKDNAFIIKVDEEVKIEFLKSAIAGKLD